MSTCLELAFACDLKADIPQQVLYTLQYMTRTTDATFDDPPTADIFEGEWWRTALQTVAMSYPFAGEGGSALRYAYRYTRGGEAVYRYTLSYRGVVSLDVLAEYFYFLLWLAPYSETQGCVGYYRNEEGDHLASPELLYFRDGRVALLTVSGVPQDLETGEPW